MSEQPFRKKQLMYGIKTRKFLTLDEANKRRKKTHLKFDDSTHYCGALRSVCHCVHFGIVS